MAGTRSKRRSATAKIRAEQQVSCGAKSSSPGDVQFDTELLRSSAPSDRPSSTHPITASGPPPSPSTTHSAVDIRKVVTDSGSLDDHMKLTSLSTSIDDALTHHYSRSGSSSPLSDVPSNISSPKSMDRTDMFVPGPMITGPIITAHAMDSTLNLMDTSDTAKPASASAVKTPSLKRVAPNLQTSTVTKRAKSDIWSENFLLENPKSILVTTDIEKLLANPQAWDVLSAEEQGELRALVPDHSLEIGVDGKVRLSSRFLQYDEHYRSHIRLFKEDLSNGRLDPDWVQQAAAAMEEREHGSFDDYKNNQFEEFWGQKQKLGVVIAGESRKVKLEEMAAFGQFLEGDIWTFSHAFAVPGDQKILVEKEARVGVSIWSLKNDHVTKASHPMAFVIPRGTTKFLSAQNVQLRVVSNAVGPSTLLKAIIEEDGRVGQMPNGNAWKDFRCVRDNQDLGTLWDMRQKYWLRKFQEDTATATDSNKVRKRRGKPRVAGTDNVFFIDGVLHARVTGPSSRSKGAQFAKLDLQQQKDLEPHFRLLDLAATIPALSVKDTNWTGDVRHYLNRLELSNSFLATLPRPWSHMLSGVSPYVPYVPKRRTIEKEKITVLHHATVRMNSTDLSRTNPALRQSMPGDFSNTDEKTSIESPLDLGDPCEMDLKQFSLSRQGYDLEANAIVELPDPLVTIICYDHQLYLYVDQAMFILVRWEMESSINPYAIDPVLGSFDPFADVSCLVQGATSMSNYYWPGTLRRQNLLNCGWIVQFGGLIWKACANQDECLWQHVLSSWQTSVPISNIENDYQEYCADFAPALPLPMFEGSS